MAKGHVRRFRGGWQVIVEAGTEPSTGKRRQISRLVRGTKGEAELVRARLLVECGDGQHRTASLTVGELMEQWYVHKVEDLSPSTAAETRRILDRVILPRLGKEKLPKLTTARIDRFYDDHRARGGVDGRPLAAASVRRVHGILRAGLEQGVRWGHLVINPAAHASPPKVPRSDIVAPEQEAVARLLTVAADDDPEFLLYVRLAAVTGARRGELCGLRWTDLDLDEAELTINRSIAMGPDGPVERPRGKTASSRRRLSLDPGTVKALAGQREAMTGRAELCGVTLSDAAFVFSNSPDCAESWRPDSVTHRFSRLRSRAGLEQVRLHDLRHFVATMLIANGMDIRSVAERLGHSSATTTLSVYAHFIRSQDQRAAAVMGGLVEPARDAI